MKNKKDMGGAASDATPTLFDPKHPCLYPWSSLTWLPQDINDDVFWSSHYHRNVKPKTKRFLVVHGISGVTW